jgi:hypothetical protein
MKQQHNAKVKLKLLATRPAVRKHTQCTRTQRMLIFHASKRNKMQPDAINSTKKRRTRRSRAEMTGPSPKREASRSNQIAAMKSDRRGLQHSMVLPVHANLTKRMQDVAVTETPRHRSTEWRWKDAESCWPRQERPTVAL